MSASELAALLEVTPQNIYGKFKIDNFSENELIKIAEKLGVRYEGYFILEDGEKI